MTGLEMPKEVVKYIAYNIQNNIRELEGALISLLAQSSLNKREIDLELAKKVLRNFIKSSSKEITIDTIQKMVCDYFDVPYEKLIAENPQTRNCTGKTNLNVPGKGIYKKFTKDNRRTFWRKRPHYGNTQLPNR